MAGVADAQFVEMATLRKRALLAAALDEFLSSSDSEDDEFFTIAAITGDCCGGKERPKVMNFVESVVRRFDNTEFRKHFRVARDVCYKVIADYEKSEFYPRGHGPYSRKTAEEHVLSFLWSSKKLRFYAVVNGLDFLKFLIVGNRNGICT
ncbi:protein ALP1-like [Ixodes scapularis]